MSNSPADTESVDTIEIEACCQACAETFGMVSAIKELIDGLMSSPMAKMMMPVPGMSMPMPGQLPPGFILPGR